MCIRDRSIHRAADRHRAGKAQQLFIRILGAQVRQYRAGRKDGKAIIPLSHKEVAFLYLLFYVPVSYTHLEA